MTSVINAIKAVQGVKSISEFALRSGEVRYYINLAGNGASFAGERSSKLYLTADGKLVFECGKGSRSNAYDDQRHAVEAAVEAASAPVETAETETVVTP